VSDTIRVALKPLGVTLELARGTPLQDVLFAHGVEFPCGGRADCGGCRVRVLDGRLPADEEQRALLTDQALEAGWRLACRCRADEDLTLELEQWKAPVLADHSAFTFSPGEGLGVAVDLGTTTLVAQLVDLATAQVLAVRTALIAQA
jgi:ferredoxin